MRLGTLALLTLKEMLHEKILAAVLVIFVGTAGLSFILGVLSFSEQQKILADFGLLAIEISTLVVAAIYGGSVLQREYERQTSLIILARPISRELFLTAKFVGIAIFNFVLVFTASLMLSVLLSIWSLPAGAQNLAIVGLSIFLKSTVVLALALVLAVHVRSALTMIFSVTVYLLGHWMSDLKFFAEKFEDRNLKTILDFFNWVCPQFYRMNWKSYYFLEKGPSSLEVGWMIVHSLSWILVLMIAARFLFRRKDLV